MKNRHRSFPVDFFASGGAVALTFFELERLSPVSSNAGLLFDIASGSGLAGAIEGKEMVEGCDGFN
jgi:hypothetical protein